MKKLITVFLIIVLIMPAVVSAENPFSEFPVDQLYIILSAVREEILLKSEWTEVELPVGFYVIGEDIPEGHWTITTNDYALVEYFSKTDETGKTADMLNGAY